MAKRHSRRGRIRLTGVAEDNLDGHARLTRARRYRLHGGCAATHARMQARAREFFERVKRRGLSVDNISRGECRAILADMGMTSEDLPVA